MDTQHLKLSLSRCSPGKSSPRKKVRLVARSVAALSPGRRLKSASPSKSALGPSTRPQTKFQLPRRHGSPIKEPDQDFEAALADYLSSLEYQFRRNEAPEFASRILRCVNELLVRTVFPLVIIVCRVEDQPGQVARTVGRILRSMRKACGATCRCAD